MKKKRCWYCHKELGPCEYVWVVTKDGGKRPVCKDDRNCRAGTGIHGHGEKPAIKRQHKKIRRTDHEK